MANKTIVGYKGFDKDWSGRGFKYGEPKGQTFTTDEQISLCNFGFHACEHPLDIWRYYPPIDDNKAASVDLLGVNEQKEADDTKRVGNSITIKAALSIADLVSASIKWVSSRVKENPKDAASIGSSGYAASIGSSGYDASIGSSGYAARIGSSGYAARIGSSGNDARIACAGYNASVKAGKNSCFCLTYFDAKSNRPRMVIGYVGENGIMADTWYRADEHGNLVPA